MSKLKAGGKSGALSGILYGIILGITNYYVFLNQKAAVLQVITNSLPPNSPYTAAQLYTATMYGVVVLFIILGLIVGAVLGVIFGLVYDMLPSKSATLKGIIFGVFIWIILDVLVNYKSLKYGSVFILESVGVGLMASLLYGFIMGRIFRHYNRKDELPEDPFADIMG